MTATGKNKEFEKWFAEWVSQVRRTGNVIANIPTDDTRITAQSDSGTSGQRKDVPTAPDFMSVSQLKRELDFLDSGGYRTETGWSTLRYFEDSPICERVSGKSCGSCLLVRFAPADSQNQPAPCHYIMLNEDGETLNNLYVTGTNQEIEAAVRSWLVSTLGKGTTADPVGRSAAPVRRHEAA